MRVSAADAAELLRQAEERRNSPGDRPSAPAPARGSLPAGVGDPREKGARKAPGELLAAFEIPGPPANKKNNQKITWPAIYKMRLYLAPKQRVKGLKQWLVLLRARLNRGNVAGVGAMLTRAISDPQFRPHPKPGDQYRRFARAAKRALDAHPDLPRPLPREKEEHLEVRADFYLAPGRAGTLDEPGVWEALFDVIEAQGLVDNDYWMTIGGGVTARDPRIWPPAGQSKAAKAAREVWRPRTMVEIYAASARRRGLSGKV